MGMAFEMGMAVKVKWAGSGGEGGRAAAGPGSHVDQWPPSDAANMVLA